MPRRIDRRTFLQVLAGAALAGMALALAGMALGTGLGLSGVQPRPEPSAPRRVLTREFHLGPSELSQGSRSGLTVGTGGLKLASGRNVGHFLSPILESDLLFNYVGLSWSSSNPDGSSLAFWIRTSPDGRSWTPWQTVQLEMPPSPLAEYDTYGALIWADRANHVQFRGELRGAREKPGVSRIGLTLLNPYDGPILETAADLSGGGFANTALAAEADSYAETAAAAAAASAKPVTFRREDWGADESLRFSGGQEIWPRSYVPTKKLVLHHTATGNTYATVQDAKALVRAIYTYHARSLGWGDIGYNSLVDKFGNSYEGRRGRDGPGYDGPGGREILSEDVVAGHALAYNYGSSGIALLGTFCTPAECSGGGSPTAAMLSRLKDVLTWESRQHGINLLGDSDFLLHYGTWHRDLPNIVGHRDVGVTSCPGGNVYALLPQLRRDVAARLASSGGPTVSISSAPPEGTVTNGEVKFVWRGSGGSGGLEYSYYLEGWSKISGSSRVNYLHGFNARKSPYWSPWTRDTGARLCYVAKGLYTFHVRVKDSSGRVGVYQSSRTFLGTTQTTACDGALLRGSAPDVFVMQYGLKRHVVSRENFIIRGFSWSDVLGVADSFLNSIPTGQPLLDALADGNLLQGSAPDVWVMESGRKRHAVSREVFLACGYFWDAVFTVPDTLLNSIPTGPPLDGSSCPMPTFADGTLLKGSPSDVWVMENGQKRHAVSREVFLSCGYLWGNVNRIADSTLGAVPNGPPLSACVPSGTLLRGSAPDVFVMQKGLKRHVVSKENFIARGFSWSDVVDVSDTFLNSIPTGHPLLDALADGNLLQGSAPDVWVMENGQKRHAVSREVFLACGYFWDAVLTVPDTLLDSMPAGPPLDGSFCPMPTFTDGTLLQGSEPDVWVMENGQKRHAVSREVFLSCGYLWGNVNHIADSTLAAIPTGDSLASEPCA